ncbi:DUF983 domain-containing protein [Hymenobacter caeli]|uniref:Uncharacterized protein (DUF983 family) n=2 Tax=Hymenobacter caeli TaxID=2735894 RepID=A0ABX2FVU3_9BACT|nr:DUF983 domain-containing protein [Hymenobacter caeli]NRT20510.1 uncharacterized protein (DUF983 family) [Hymenobacter caeli]
MPKLTAAAPPARGPAAGGRLLLPVMDEPAPTSSSLALLALRCPRCHEGHLFLHPATNLTGFTDMPAYCPVCGQSFEPEPGFYFGAMYISFGFAVGVFFAVGVALYFLAGDPDTWVYVVGVSLVTLVCTPLVFRYSRALMLYLFGGTGYDPEWARRVRRE